MHVSTYILLYDAGIPDEIVLALSLLVACCLLHKGGLRKPKVCRYVNPLYDLMSRILDRLRWPSASWAGAAHMSCGRWGCAQQCSSLKRVWSLPRNSNGTHHPGQVFLNHSKIVISKSLNHKNAYGIQYTCFERCFSLTKPGENGSCRSYERRGGKVLLARHQQWCSASLWAKPQIRVLPWMILQLLPILW